MARSLHRRETAAGILKTVDLSISRMVKRVMAISGRRSVLIIDDDADMRSALELLLTDDGYDVSSAIHGADALKQLEVIAPDLILLDLNMPVMDGETFASSYRLQYGDQVPIIVCTSAPPPSIAERIRNATVMKKPMELDDLLSAVQHLSETGSV